MTEVEHYPDYFYSVDEDEPLTQIKNSQGEIIREYLGELDKWEVCYYVEGYVEGLQKGKDVGKTTSQYEIRKALGFKD